MWYPLFALVLAIGVTLAGMISTVIFRRTACPLLRRRGQQAALACLLGAGVLTMCSLACHDGAWYLPACSLCSLVIGASFDGQREVAA